MGPQKGFKKSNLFKQRPNTIDKLYHIKTLHIFLITYTKMAGIKTASNISKWPVKSRLG